MPDEQKAQREPIEILDELATVTEKQFQQIQHGRGFGKRVRAAAATQRTVIDAPDRKELRPAKRGGRPAGHRLLQVERPVGSTSRAKPRGSLASFPRATAGMVVWREIPSWHQKREPNSAAALLSPTKSPPWVRKRRARAKSKLQKASRVANRG